MALSYDFRVQDRRQEIPFFCAYHLGLKKGRRVNERRIETEKGYAIYVDQYSDSLLFCVLGILVLSVCDAFFTLKILAHGGEELNWFMAVLIDESVTKFIAVKMALTSLALLLLVIHQNVTVFYNMKVRHLKYVILSGYSILIGYELYLLELASTGGM